MAFRFDNMDAAFSAFFNRQLEHIRSKLIEEKFPDLHALEWVPMSESVHPGATSFVTRSSRSVGEVAIASTMSARGPRGDVTVAEGASGIVSLQNAYGWSIQDIRSAQLAGFDLSGAKARAAKLAIAQKMDNILLLADGTATWYGLYGLFKLPTSGGSSVGVYTVPADGTGASALWTAKTPDLILRDMNGIVHKQVIDTKEVDIPNEMKLPLAAWTHIATTPRSSTSDTTILEYFLKTSPYIKSVVPSSKLDDAGASSVGRMVVYKKDPEILEAVVPILFEQFAPQLEGTAYVTECHARVGGIDLHRPKGVTYGDGVSA